MHAGPAPARTGEVCLVFFGTFVFALLVRLAAIDATIGFRTPAVLEPAADSRIHITLAQSLLNGGGFSFGGNPTGNTPPLYIFFLAGLYRLFGTPVAVRCVQAVMGAACCMIVYAIGQRLFDHRTGLVAAAILGLYPLTVYLTGLHLTENLFLFLILLMLLQSLRVMERPTGFAAAVLGGLIGLAALTRATFVAFLPFLLAWAVSFWGIRSPVAYRILTLVAVSTVIVITPWTFRNYRVLGAVVPVQSNGGLMFWAGNNPYSDGGLVWPNEGTWTSGKPPDTDQYAWKNLTVSQENRLYVETALSWIRGHPRDYLHLLGRKLVHLYGFTRASDRQELAVPPTVSVFHLAFLATAFSGLFLTIRRWRALSLLFSLIVFTHLTALLFSGATRYTIPMVPSLTLLAAFALVTGWTHVSNSLCAGRIPVEG